MSKQPFPNYTHLKTFIAVDRFDVTVTDAPRGTKLLGLWSSTWEWRALDDPEFTQERSSGSSVTGDTDLGTRVGGGIGKGRGKRG